jgi:hypothetical protein
MRPMRQTRVLLKAVPVCDDAEMPSHDGRRGAGTESSPRVARVNVPVRWIVLVLFVVQSQ